MKKKIMLSLAAMMIFGLAIVAVAYTYAGNSASAAAISCCCCHGDSCPMQAKGADGKPIKMDAATCCDNCENCCHGDGASCPMMKKDADGNPVKMGDAKSCPMKEMGATDATATKTDDAKSCPMMKKDADGKPMKMDAAHGTHMKHDMKMDGSGCCCACCQETKDKEMIAAPAA